MQKRLFVTGVSGYIGRKFIQQVDPTQYEKIYCLSRQAGQQPIHPGANGTVQWLTADIEDAQSYLPYLACSDTVVHLAAVTGKASRQEYYRVNGRGTQTLVEASRRAGVSRFLYVSTIAVKYPERSHYYYAESKEVGEQAVQASGLDYAIVRPTLVIGEGSPIWINLAKLANAPVLPLFGGGQNQVQPIFVDDLVNCLVSLMDEGQFNSQTYELGGPDELTLEAFLRSIRKAYSKNGSPSVSIPVRPAKQLLSRIEGFYPMIPVTAGQLSSFQNDSVILNNPLFERRAGGMIGVQEMLRLTVGAERSRNQASRLEQECRQFTRYLTGQEPNSYVLEKYREAHGTARMFEGAEADSFDSLLERLAASGNLRTRLVDAYTALFRRSCPMRRKLVLLLAILESSAPSYQHFETNDASGVPTLVLKLAANGLRFGLASLLAVILLAPVQALIGLGARLQKTHGTDELRTWETPGA